jgi:hypothetical protein
VGRARRLLKGSTCCRWEERRFLDVTEDNGVTVEEGESLELRWSEDKMVGSKIEFDRDSLGEQLASNSADSRFC